jgi:large subunit ribosomal protein L32e
MPRMKKKFLRRDWNKMLRLGGRRKKLKWRRSKGRHAKIRQKWKGYSPMPSPGYKSPRATKGFVQGKKSVMINNLSDLSKVKSNEIGIVARLIGKKNRIVLAKKALELKVHLANMDASKYLEEIKKEHEAKIKAKEKPKAHDKISAPVQVQKKAEDKTEIKNKETKQ